MDYHFSRVAIHIDGEVAAIVQLMWDPEICSECNDRHYEVMFGHGYIDLKAWKYRKAEFN